MKTLQAYPFLYIVGTLFFTVYGQIVLKWRITKLKIELPENLYDKLQALFKLLIDPLVLSGFLSAFIASLFWMAAMTKFEITRAYPFMSIAPALVFLIGTLFLGETFTIGKILGLLLIVLGSMITVKF
ncbi:EamA family transporter [Pedobacter sp.]|uniref:EamA family transporter n=1 Tax=Pedobacter sp. TaxID=1411316 RepID=UPI003D7F47CE